MLEQTFWFLAVLAVIGSISAHDHKHSGFGHFMRPFVDECMAELNVTKEQMREMWRDRNEEHIDPCFHSCVFKKAGVMNEKGMYDIEKATEIAKSLYKDEESLTKYIKSIATCSAVNDKEMSDGEKGCERANLLFNCFIGEKHKGLWHAMHPIVVECFDEFEEVTMDQIHEMWHSRSADKIDPCFLGCFFKKTGIINEQGNFDVAKTSELLTAHIKDEDRLAKYNKAKDTCITVNDEEVTDGEKGCDRAKLLFGCFMIQKRDDHE